MRKKVFIAILWVMLATAFATAQTVIPGGYVSGTWTASGSPYIIEGDIAVHGDSTLIIEPGVEICFNHGTGLTVDGYLSADGTTQPGTGDTILFTENISGGGWDGITITADTCSLTFCAVEYGSYLFFVSYGDNLTLTDSRVSLPIIIDSTILNLIRCLITVDCEFWAGNYYFDDCFFTGSLSWPEAGSAIINSSTIMQDIDFFTWGELQVADSYVGGNVDCLPDNDCDIYFTNCTINGSILNVGDMNITNCIINGGLNAIGEWEVISVYIYDSSINGDILIDWAYCTMSGSAVNGNIQLLDARSANLNGNSIFGDIFGSLTDMGYGISANNNLISGYIDVSGFSGSGCDFTICGNRVVNSSESGISAEINGLEGNSAHIENNTIYNAQNQGINVTYSTYENIPVYIKNNIVSICGGYGICLSTLDSVDVSYNDTWQCSLGNYLGVDPGPGSIRVDPQFVDPSNGDFDLQRISPCIDVGDPYSPLDPDSTIADIGARYFHQSMPVKLTLTPENPPIIIPSSGGEFEFNIEATNRTAEPQTFDLWTEIELPGWGSIEIINAFGLTLASGDTVDRDRSQGVPDFAPQGTYTYLAYVGTYPWVVDDYYYFYFEKEGNNQSVSLGSPSDWPCSGEPFSEETSPNKLLPDEFELSSPFPNPFNPTTTLRFSLPEAARVNLSVFDISGHLVSTLVEGYRDAGIHQVTFDASHLASGIYVYRLTTGNFTASGKMMLMK